jgi:hypothetical protein
MKRPNALGDDRRLGDERCFLGINGSAEFSSLTLP